MPRCNRTGCNAIIMFAITTNGKRMPLNAEADPEGNVAVSTDEHGGLTARVLVRHDPEIPVAPGRGETIYMPHYATCKAIPPPKMTAVTEQNAGQVARRRPRFVDAQGLLPLDMPSENVTPIRRR
jgi:hypothetical protein